MYNRNCANNGGRGNGNGNDNDQGRGNENDQGRGEGRCHKEPCRSNPHEYSYDKVVATWKTVRHYKITTFDTIEPVCTDGLCDDDMRDCVGGDCCTDCRR
ncbi:MAG: hypothetical protein FWE84_06300 [Firmicutes bacterium]|nr:hypothetical protein [Bacillota bacterium]